MIEKLIQYNLHWAGLQNLSDESYFDRLSEGQAPEYLWIGCSDSRVPAESLLGLKPGQLFVHRNIANQIHVDDNNSMSVLQYAVEVLKTRHIIVCGHSSCGGVEAAFDGKCDGYIEQWLSGLTDLCHEKEHLLNQKQTRDEKLALLTELNVQQQVDGIAELDIVKAAWARGQQLEIHGWVFDIPSGLLKDLDMVVSADSSISGY
jgi:carbonic anhydrase